QVAGGKCKSTQLCPLANWQTRKHFRSNLMFKKALDITWLYLKMTYSSRSILIFQLLLPVLFTFMVGHGTGGFDGPSSTTVTWPLAVANEDSGLLGAALVEMLSADPNLEVTTIAASEVETAVTTDEAVA